MSENDLTEAELLELGAATLGESGGRAMRARIRAAWSGARLAAPAFPVRCTPGDNLAIHVAVAEAPAGYALVVDVGDQPELGYWGEVLTTGAQARGLAGLVIDGGVRDVSALAAHHFPVFSTMIALRGDEESAGERRSDPDRRRRRRHKRRLGRRRRRRRDRRQLPTHLRGAHRRPCPVQGRRSSSSPALRAGTTTMTLLDLDGTPVTRARSAARSVLGVVDRAGIGDADGEAEAVDRRVVADRAEAVHRVGRDVHEVALADLAVSSPIVMMPRPEVT